MTPGRDDMGESRPAGPVAGQSPSSSQAAGEGSSPTPPAGGDSAQDAHGRAAGSSGAGQPDAEKADAAREVEADLDKLLEDTKRERDEYLELARRTKADFENFRKRMTAETAAALERGKAEVIRGMLPVLDDLERAIEAAGIDPEGDAEDGLAQGVQLVFRSLRETLGRSGVEAVDPKGERFDPQLHEALSTQPRDGVEPGTVIEVMQKGYRLGEQLVRPARVVVAE